MKFTCQLSVLAVLACVCLARGDEAKSAGSDAKALQGTWQLTTGEMAGKAFPDEVAKSIRLVLSDGKYVVTVGDRPDEGTTKIDPTKTPKALDVVGVKGPNEGKTFPAIYELKGDTLRVCYDLSGKTRPTEFKSKPNSMLFLATYRREKK